MSHPIQVSSEILRKLVERAELTLGGLLDGADAATACNLLRGHRRRPWRRRQKHGELLSCRCAAVEPGLNMHGTDWADMLG